MILNFIFLAGFDVIKPEVGLIFWTTVIFLIFWFLMARFAFGPIKDALKKREFDIQNSLDEAKRARDEMANLKAENDRIISEAREERTKILKEAKELSNTMINDAKIKAKEEAQRIVVNAKNEIENQKTAAMIDVKNQAGLLALQIAERVIRKELKGNNEQEQFAQSLVDEINLS